MIASVRGAGSGPPRASFSPEIMGSRDKPGNDERRGLEVGNAAYLWWISFSPATGERAFST